MNSLFRHGLIVAVLFVTFAAFLGCGDDNTSGGGTPDTTPPTVLDVVPLDANHVRVTFDEALSRTSAERTDNYTIGEVIAAQVNAVHRGSGDWADNIVTAPGQIGIFSAALVGNSVVFLTTGSSMNNVAYDLVVRRVSDVSGNTMAGETTKGFTGLSGPDETDPFVTTRTPGIGATGVGTSQPVVVTFCEPMMDQTVFAAFSWISIGGTVPVMMQKPEQNVYAFSPLVPLARSTTFTVSLANTATDLAGNPLTPASWTFRTTDATDTTTPALVASTPTDGATDVSTSTALELRFSEPINPMSMREVVITPSPSNGTDEWLDGGRTVRFTPDEPLVEDTQYMLVIPGGAIEDMAGNVNDESYTVQFTTGSSFAPGVISGTLTGDLYSVTAGDPTGALVVATTVGLFGPAEDDIDVLGVGFVVTDDSYSIPRLPDGRYYPFAIMDSNGDGVLDPNRGDAIGAFGADPRGGDFTQTPVYIDNGVTLPADVGFPLFDPEAISGTVVYDGETYRENLPTYAYAVGAFDVINFDPQNLPEPVAGTEGGSLGQDPEYAINTLDNGLTPGTYFVGCFMDVNFNGTYEPATDPAGFYRDLETGDFYPVAVENGTDAVKVVIHIDDPAAAASFRHAVAWRAAQREKDKRVSLKAVNAKIQNILHRLDSGSR